MNAGVVREAIAVEPHAVLDLEIVRRPVRVAERRAADVLRRRSRVRGESWRVNDAGVPASRSASELKREVPSSFVVRSCAYWSRRSSVVSLSRCLLFSLNHDSVFIACAVVVVMLMFIAGLPPNARFCTPDVPSANVEFTRTDAVRQIDERRAVEPHPADADRRLAQDAEAEVAGVLAPGRRRTSSCARRCAPAARSLDSPAGSCRFHAPLNVTLNAWPVVDDGGVKSSVPKTSALSLSARPGCRRRSAERCHRPRMLSRSLDRILGRRRRRCRPSASVLSKL